MEDLTRYCPFTQFTHQLLIRDELSRVISHLQHESGFNVNIVLYFLWLAKSSYGRLTCQDLKFLQGQVMLWHQRVIAELKYTHALVVNSADPTAIHIKQVLQEEIVKAHIIEQQMLYDTRVKVHVLRRSMQQQVSDACASMMHYCQIKNDLLADEDRDAFIYLFACVFPHVVRFEIEQQIDAVFNQMKMKPNRQLQMMWEEF